MFSKVWRVAKLAGRVHAPVLACGLASVIFVCLFDGLFVCLLDNHATGRVIVAVTRLCNQPARVWIRLLPQLDVVKSFPKLPLQQKQPRLSGP